MDATVYEMSSSSENSPSIFLRKDYISIQDNNNNNYSSGQLVLDTSVLANSNRYCGFREGYLFFPLLLTVTSSQNFDPTAAVNSFDYCVGLKNNYASVIHSMSLDMNGTQVIQTTPFISLINSFRLLTTLSWQEVHNYGSSIGFYPDNSTSFKVSNIAGANGIGVCNNQNGFGSAVVNGALNAQDTFNRGFYERQRAWNMNPNGVVGVTLVGGNQAALTYNGANGLLLNVQTMNQIYKSHVFNVARDGI